MKMRTPRHIASFVLILALALVVSAQDDSATKTYKGTLSPGAEKTFKISAKIGQYINAKITSENGNVLIAEEEGARELTMEVVDPDYELVIRNQGKKAEKYELKITVFTPEPEPAEKIEFAENETEKTIDLTMYPYKLKRRFSIMLEAGSGARISIDPEAAASRLGFRIVPVDGSDSPGPAGFPFLIRADRDGSYVFEILKLDEVLLEAKITIEILAEDEFRDPSGERR